MYYASNFESFVAHSSMVRRRCQARDDSEFKYTDLRLTEVKDMSVREADPKYSLCLDPVNKNR